MDWKTMVLTRSKSVLDETFGSDNFVSLITFKETAGATSEFLSPVADYILWYARSREELKYHTVYLGKAVGGSGADAYDFVEPRDGLRRRLTAEERSNPALIDDGGRVFRHQILTSPRIREARTGYYPVSFQGREFLPTTGEWKTHREGMPRLVAADRIVAEFVNDFETPARIN